MLKSKPYERIMPKEDLDITEYYTAEQIAEKYKVAPKWVWTYTREHKIPKVKIRQFNYYSKKHIDAAFSKYNVDNDLTEWYTPEEIQEKYGMTRVAIRSQVYRHNIPSKKEHGLILYSKVHFDLSKSSELEKRKEYYISRGICRNRWAISPHHRCSPKVYPTNRKNFNIATKIYRENF